MDFLNLNGSSVDEEADFRHSPGIDSQIVTAAQTLFEWARPNTAIPPPVCAISTFRNS